MPTMQHGVADQLRQRVARQHAHADGRMGLDDRIFFIRQSVRLAQDRIGYADFTQIVQEAAESNARGIGIVETCPFRQQACIARHPP
ncbi:hypothetical protein ECAE60S_01471 [Eoetvoesiella caeni]